MKKITRVALSRYPAHRYLPDEVTKIILNIDGGGIRRCKDGDLPATWSVNVITEPRDGSKAFDRYLCGAVSCDPADSLVMGRIRPLRSLRKSRARYLLRHGFWVTSQVTRPMLQWR